MKVKFRRRPHPLPESFFDKDRVNKKPSIQALEQVASQIIARKVKIKRPKIGDVPHKKPAKGVFSPNPNKRKSFYASWEWRRLRMETLLRYGHRCQSCGATKDDITITGATVRLVVDHIQPLGKNWELRLDPENVQVLCDECNMGKGDWDATDFRPTTAS